MTVLVPTAYEAALQAWVRRVVASRDVPAPTPPALTPVAHTYAVLIEDQDGATRPPLPYASIRVLSTYGLGRNERYAEPNEEDETQTDLVISQTREGTVTITFYGAGHDAAATDVELSLDDPDEVQTQEDAGVTVSHALMRRSEGRVSGRTVEDRTVTDYVFRYIEERITPDVDTADNYGVTAQLVTPNPEYPEGPPTPVGEVIELVLPEEFE